MLDERPLTYQEVQDRQQYWYSKWCNCVDVPHKKVYMQLYNSYVELEKLLFKNERTSRI